MDPEHCFLKEVTEEERLAAIDLVNKKEIGQLVAGIGPHRDTVLSILSAQRKSQNPGNAFLLLSSVADPDLLGLRDPHPDP
jgi:hypothetical protein